MRERERERIEWNRCFIIHEEANFDLWDHMREWERLEKIFYRPQGSQFSGDDFTMIMTTIF